MADKGKHPSTEHHHEAAARHSPGEDRTRTARGDKEDRTGTASVSARRTWRGEDRTGTARSRGRTAQGEDRTDTARVPPRRTRRWEDRTDTARVSDLARIELDEAALRELGVLSGDSPERCEA
jgi:hypothetical protein